MSVRIAVIGHVEHISLGRVPAVPRAARLLLATGRRRTAIVASGVRVDVIVGSALDPREAWSLADFPRPPEALVLTEGAAGGTVHTADGMQRFSAPLARPGGG